jgi:AcrR family transcriptional regulator
MPKIVDHEKQREKIAEATWRVIMRDGMEKATVRNIAREAGVSVGSLRHYFSSQSELLAFSMKLVSERVKKRIKGIVFSCPPLEGMKRLIRELLPLEEETRKEMEVWFAFNQKALWDPDLQPLSNQVYHELRSAIELIIETLIKLELAKPNLDVEIEVERLYALIDGLAMHGIMQPNHLTTEMIESIVDHHLRSICR